MELRRKTGKGKLKNLGPGAIIAAAFIGPGTVTACSRAGASFGFALLWALLFSTLATIVLQEMSARLGVISQQNLGEAIRSRFEGFWVRGGVVTLVLAAIVMGNSAYEAGNIVGGAMGLEVISGIGVAKWGPLIGISAWALLWFGSYRGIEKVFVAMVVFMSLVFLATAVFVGPSVSEIVKGLFLFNLPSGSTMFVIALIGTTVVPYNLFLHSAAVRERWKDPKDLKAARWDTVISMGVGGLISMAILVTAAMAYPSGGDVKTGSDMAIQLQPLLGRSAKILFGCGIFAAGITSAITAPLAASYAAAGVLGWKNDFKNLKFRLIWLCVLLVGTACSWLGYSPTQIITFAQYANGLLLPLVAVFLLVVMNDVSKLKNHVNTWPINLAGVAVIAITILLSLRSFGMLK